MTFPKWARTIGGLLLERFWNWYTIRAAIVLVVAAIAPAIDPRIVHAIDATLAAIDLGDRSQIMLAVFGGGYVMLDLIRARRKAMPEAGPDHSWVAK